jgi:hypothetical protein
VLSCVVVLLCLCAVMLLGKALSQLVVRQAVSAQAPPTCIFDIARASCCLASTNCLARASTTLLYKLAALNSAGTSQKCNLRCHRVSPSRQHARLRPTSGSTRSNSAAANTSTLNYHETTRPTRTSSSKHNVATSTYDIRPHRHFHHNVHLHCMYVSVSQTWWHNRQLTSRSGGQESVNVGVKPSPLPQWGLNCSHCGGLNGSGSYSQFEEFKITEAPERAADWDKADMEVEGSSVPDTLSGEFYIVEVTEQAADCDEAGMEEEGMVATAC